MDDATRAEHGKRQREQYDRFLEIRIRLEPLMNQSFAWPRSDVRMWMKREAASETKAFVRTRRAMEDCANDLSEILSDLLEIRDATCTMLGGGRTDRKTTTSEDRATRKRTRPNEWASYERDVLGSSFRDVFMPNASATIDAWHRKAQLLSGDMTGTSGRKRLRALNQTAMRQVNEVMADADRLIRVSQERPVAVPQFSFGEDPDEVRGNASTTSSTTSRRFVKRKDVERRRRGRRVDEETYSDAPFYAALLKQFLETQGAATTHNNAVRVKKRGGRRGPNVDRRATKGRKLKYIEHPKLLNFMTPEALPTIEIDVDRLFASLFRSSK